MGKNKYIETPDKMWELFVEYRDDVKSNPRIKTEYVGKDGERVGTPLERPLTMSGFECYIADKGIAQTIDQYFSNQDGLYNDYMGICTRIRKAIRQDQIEGGMVGQYNSSITQRLNGLVDRQQTEVKAEPRVFNIPK